MKTQRKSPRHRQRLAHAGVLSSATALCLALLTPGIAHAGELDQHQEDTSLATALIRQDDMGAQTFTPSISGDLDRVDVFVARSAEASSDLTLEIRNVTPDGQPGDVLSTVDVPISAVPTEPGGWVTVNLDSPQPVIAETQYAIVVQTQETRIRHGLYWNASSGDQYSRGQMWGSFPAGSEIVWQGSPNSDRAFRTYVDAPKADLKLDMSATTNQTLLPDIQYKAVVANDGPGTAENTTLSMVYTRNLGNVRVDDPQTCSVNTKTRTITCNLNNLDAGNSSTHVVTFKAELLALGKLTVNGTATSTTEDPNTSNNNDSASCTATTGTIVTC